MRHEEEFQISIDRPFRFDENKNKIYVPMETVENLNGHNDGTIHGPRHKIQLIVNGTRRIIKQRTIAPKLPYNAQNSKNDNGNDTTPSTDEGLFSPFTVCSNPYQLAQYDFNNGQTLLNMESPIIESIFYSDEEARPEVRQLYAEICQIAEFCIFYNKSNGGKLLETPDSLSDYFDNPIDFAIDQHIRSLLFSGKGLKLALALNPNFDRTILAKIENPDFI